MESTVLGLEGVFCQVVDIYERHGASYPHDPRMMFIASLYDEENKGDAGWLHDTYAPEIPLDEFASGSLLVEGKMRSHFKLAIESLLNDLRKNFPEED